MYRIRKDTMDSRSKQGAYHHVSTTDDGFSNKMLNGPDLMLRDAANLRKQNLQRLLYRTTLVFLLALIGLAGFIVGSCVTSMQGIPALWPATVNQGGTIEECGETPDEARISGCKFDPMMQVWLPASCYDEEHSEFYLSTYQWKWYYDNKMEKEMPDEVMRRGDHSVSFMTDDYHRRHCAYAWEVVTRALQAQRPIQDELLSYKHVHHCNMVLFWNTSESARGVETHAGFGRCAPYHVWAKDMPK